MNTIIAQPGTTLFHVSLNYLGDALQWFRIAGVNGIRDPFLNNLTIIEIPGRQMGSGERQ